MSSQREEDEEDSESDMMSSPPPPPLAGFSDQNKEWLKPAMGKKKTKKKQKAEDVQPQRSDLLDGSDGDSGHELGEGNVTVTLCHFKLTP